MSEHQLYIRRAIHEYMLWDYRVIIMNGSNWCMKDSSLEADWRHQSVGLSRSYVRQCSIFMK